jgi:alpha-glucosidase
LTSKPAYIASLHHDGSNRYVRPNAGLRVGDEVVIRLRTSLTAPLQRVLLRTCPDGEQAFVEMQPEDGEACCWWQASLRLTMPVTGYRFLLFADDGLWVYNGSGAHRHVPTDAEDFRLLADYAAPDWVCGSVFYQIFPDRFADGDPESNVKTGEFEVYGLPASARAWGEAQSPWPQAMVEFYGGDLPGVEQKLDYLAELGVNALYLNPIFTALSNHRYDVTDYHAVDPHLGGDAALISLRQALAARGMRLILDLVPNHCGQEHPWFQAALQDPNAPTADFFTFHRHPDDYECWLGVKGLPKLNYRSAALREAIYAGPRSVFRHWLRPPFAIDGWRVDVANMLARHGADQLEAEVWDEIRQAVKEENPAAYLLGENFFDGTPQLQGDKLDATMNYAGFTHPLWYWLNRFEVNQHGEPHNVQSAHAWPTEALVESWQASRAALPWTIAGQQFNLLGSHDTPRALSLVAGDLARVQLAAALLLTYVGVPCIYYGDEIGMHGKDGLEARNCMPWEPSDWNLELRAFYQRLIHLRRTSPALLEGGFQVLAAEKNVLAYLRDAEAESLIVVGNRGPEERPAGLLPVAHGAIPDGTVFTELFSGQTCAVSGGMLLLPVVPVGVQIWQARP